MGNANVYSILSAKKLRQSIDVLDLARIAHVPTMRTLRQFVTQVRHGDVRTLALKQAANPVLASSAAADGLAWLKIGDDPGLVLSDLLRRRSQK
jgi:hypothetical protein